MNSQQQLEIMKICAELSERTVTLAKELSRLAKVVSSLEESISFLSQRTAPLQVYGKEIK